MVLHAIKVTVASSSSVRGPALLRPSGYALARAEWLQFVVDPLGYFAIDRVSLIGKPSCRPGRSTLGKVL